MMSSLNRSNLKLLPEYAQDLLPHIWQKVRQQGQKIIILDDDPTGTQTVYDVPVLTDWSVERLCAELQTDDLAFYILTNSRSLSAPEACILATEIGQNIREASRLAQRPFTVISRSDSTLRGHFPDEVDALVQTFDNPVDAWLLIPFFAEGGRITVDDVHYVQEKELLIPVGETPFAQDKAFGFTASNLRDWVIEKGNGRFSPHQITSITLTDLRQNTPAYIAQKLLDLPRESLCIVNAVSNRDIEMFVAGLLDAEATGKRYVYRTAASFVRARLGLPTQDLWRLPDVRTQNGGLVIVGSYVPKTTQQVRYLLAQGNVVGIEVAVASLLDEQTQVNLIEQVAQEADGALQQGKDVIIYTSRQLIAGMDGRQSLAIGQRVSDSLVQILHQIQVRPRYILAKGGITSSDVATHGLGIKRAMVLGQLLPGVPVWRTSIESRYPDLPYVVFPGNVGGETALWQAVQNLSDST